MMWIYINFCYRKIFIQQCPWSSVLPTVALPTQSIQNENIFTFCSTARKNPFTIKWKYEILSHVTCTMFFL